MGKNIKGLGDVVAGITKFAGIQPCEACERRREQWNQLFPIKLQRTVREMTPEELKQWKEFQGVRTMRLSNEQRKFVCRIYSDVFRVPYFEPCPTCDAAPYLRMIEKMDAITKTYEET